MINRFNLLIKNVIKYPLVVIFGVVILVMFARYIIMPDNDFSDVENRSLQTMPTISLSSIADGSYMAKFETYTTEQLPFRETLVKVKALLKEMSLCNENNGIVRGREDYLFEMSYGISSQYGKNAAAIRKFTESADTQVYIAIAPTAASVLNDYVPTGFKTIDQNSELIKLETSLVQAGKENIHFVNLYDTISEHANLKEQMYYRTDHHWTSLAAYYAYCEIINAVNEENTTGDLLSPVMLGSLNCHEADDFYGTHFAKFKEYDVKPDTLTYYDIPIEEYERSDGIYDSLYDLEKLGIYDKYAMFMRGNDDISIVRSDNFVDEKTDAKRSLIVFKDSYANCLIPFLTYNYDTITVVDLRYYSDSVSALLENNGDSDILLLYNFDFLNEDNHFYRLTS